MLTSAKLTHGPLSLLLYVLQSLMTQHKAHLYSCTVKHGHAAVFSYPFDSLQVSFQQTVQRKGDDVVHVLELEEGEERNVRLCQRI